MSKHAVARRDRRRRCNGASFSVPAALAALAALAPLARLAALAALAALV